MRTCIPKPRLLCRFAGAALMLAYATALTIGVAIAAERSRTRELFDFDWRFSNEDTAGAARPEFDDTSWRAIDLPHDFAIEGPFIGKDVKGAWANGYRPFGVGWYRKRFTTPEPAAGGRRVSLEFEGVYRAAQVWVNGVAVGGALNGYLDFAVDVTGHLRPPGEANVVAVRADNTVPETSRWYTGGGIHRHVWLTTTGSIAIERDGVYVTTPTITPAEAWVRIETEVRNTLGSDQLVTLISDVCDPDGKPVASTTTILPVRGGELFTFRQELSVPAPRLWSLEQPHLYTVDSRVRAAGVEFDRVGSSFGIREIRLTPEGLFLNGRRVLVKGFNLHHDHGTLGAAAFERAIERRLEIIKEIGCNAVRLSHNPHARAALDLCDRMGLLVYDEAYDKWGGQFYGSNDGWTKEWRRDLAAFVRRDRNHPSVFIWSVGNEVGHSFNGPDFGMAQFDAMAEVVRRNDPTRPVTSALFPMRENAGREGTKQAHPNWREYEPHQLALRMDVMSANYMESYFARDRLKYPHLVYIASESTTGDGGRPPWASLDREHAVGLFYWGGVNYLGETVKWPLKAWSSGFVGRTGFRTAASWDVQSYFSPRPMVRLVMHDPGPDSAVIWNEVKLVNNRALSHWTFRRGRSVSVEAYTNAEDVELRLNGRSLGRQTRTGEPGVGPRLRWDVPFEPGTIEALAYQAGREVARHALRTAGPAHGIRLSPDRSRLRADGQDLSHLLVEIVDAAGVVVPDSRARIDFTVLGAGTNAGVDNDDPITEELFQASHHTAFRGEALLVVRAARRPGAIEVTATADGLAPARARLEAVSP